MWWNPFWGSTEKIFCEVMGMNINPGELNKKIQIIKILEKQDESGFLNLTEEVVRICYARYSSTSGSEILKAGSEFSSAKVRFLVRYSPEEISTDMVVRYAGKDYNIEYINPYGDSREYLEIWTSLMEMR